MAVSVDSSSLNGLAFVSLKIQKENINRLFDTSYILKQTDNFVVYVVVQRNRSFLYTRRLRGGSFTESLMMFSGFFLTLKEKTLPTLSLMEVIQSRLSDTNTFNSGLRGVNPTLFFCDI